jgi:glycosyltransferase involved in cell wall biosynthesis
MKRILFLITTQAKDGPGNVLINLVNHLDNHKYDIYIAYLYYTDSAEENIFGYITKPVEYFNLNMKSPLNGWLDMLVIKRIRNIINEKDIDILHMHLHRAIIFGTYAANNIVRISTIHNMEPHQNPKSLFEFVVKILENNALKKANYITTVSNAVKCNLIKYYSGLKKNNIHVIYNGIDDSKAMESYSLRQVYGLKNELIIASIGRLEHQKGISYLIRALKLLDNKTPIAYKLLIIGEGNERQKLELLVDKMGLRKNIIFTGYLNNVNDVLNEVDILIMPSLFEGLGLALLEAMSKGVCCLGTDAGGIPEVLGAVVPIIKKKDSKMLAEILCKYMLNNELRKNAGQKLRQRYFEMFTSDMMAKKYMELYDR